MTQVYIRQNLILWRDKLRKRLLLKRVIGNALELYKQGPPPVNYLELFQKSLRRWKELSTQKNSVHDVTCRYNAALVAKVFAQMRIIAQDYLLVEEY